MHLAPGNGALALDPVEDRRAGSGARVDDGAGGGRQHPREVFVEPAVGDMRERSDRYLADEVEDRPYIDAGRHEEGFGQRPPVERLGKVGFPVLDEPPDQGITVRCGPLAAIPMSASPARTARVDDRAGLHHPDAEAGEVVVPAA